MPPTLYEGMKKATGPPTSKIPPLKANTGETISDSSQQLARWVEHYLELYATLNEVSRSALDSIPGMPIMEELDVLPTIEKLDKAINTLANRKTPGADGIPPEILNTGKPALMQHLYELLCLCGKKAMFLKICGTQSLSPSTRTRAIAVTAITTEAFRFSVLLGRPLLGFLSAACKSLRRAFTLSISAALDRADLRLT